jgi:hypothetical protein
MYSPEGVHRGILSHMTTLCNLISKNDLPKKRKETLFCPSHLPKTVFTINPLQFSTKTENPEHDIMDGSCLCTGKTSIN